MDVSFTLKIRPASDEGRFSVRLTADLTEDGNLEREVPIYNGFIYGAKLNPTRRVETWAMVILANAVSMIGYEFGNMADRGEGTLIVDVNEVKHL